MPDEQVKQWGEQTPAMPRAAPAECNDFHADKELGRRNAKYEVTGKALTVTGAHQQPPSSASTRYDLIWCCAGIFAILCRHGVLLKALNMVTGERWAYATMLLDFLMRRGIVPQFFW